MENKTIPDNLIEDRTAAISRKMIHDFAPEIREIFYQAYGAELENLPAQVSTRISMYDLLESLSKLHSPRKQKIILMYFGIATGEPMPVEKIAEEAGATADTIKTILYSALKVCRPPERAGKLHDYLPE